jgi:hypothetical protein
MDVSSEEQPIFPQYTEEKSEAWGGRGGGHRAVPGGDLAITKTVSITDSVLSVKRKFSLRSQKLGA